MSATPPSDTQQDPNSTSLDAALGVYLAEHPNSTAAQIQKDLGLTTKPNSALYRGLRAGRFLCLESKPPRWSLNPGFAEMQDLQTRLDAALQAASPGWVAVRELGLAASMSSDPEKVVHAPPSMSQDPGPAAPVPPSKKQLNKLLYQGNKEGRYEFQLAEGTTKPVWRLKIPTQ